MVASPKRAEPFRPIIANILRLRDRYETEHGRLPRYVVLSMEMYAGLRAEFGIRPRQFGTPPGWARLPVDQGPALIAGLHIVAIPGNPETCCVVAYPWEEILVVLHSEELR